YDLAVKKHRRTTAGVSGLDMDQIVDFIGGFLDGTPANPRKDISWIGIEKLPDPPTLTGQRSCEYLLSCSGVC
ncbi:MAG: hypothetical protein KJO34_16490, partial [Deltaproteobacteria bacterium]|nr:hypothetical protein [Deltaproteobacteria bacterium]